MSKAFVIYSHYDDKSFNCAIKNTFKEYYQNGKKQPDTPVDASTRDVTGIGIRST